jgi:Protein of unknown function (DUF2726)
MFSTLIISLIVVVVLLALAGAAEKLKSQNEGKQTGAPAYEAIPNLLTAAERSFFGVLQQAVSAEYQIFAKVRLADIVRPIRNPSRSSWQTAFNRITGKHVDFVLCDPSRLSIVAVVELDDSSHERLERGVRDNLVDSALADAAIPVLRVSARQSYSPVQIREQIKNVISAPNKK